MPFEINDSESPLGETDPDVQFYPENHYIETTFCDYYFEDDFNSRLETNVTLQMDSFFPHMTTKSLPPKS